uniref:Casein kinase I n=1 Tax=Lotharella globosa TaxID=91324 RepID=A0A6V3JB66_9EUKA|mmetsp:Transcript_33214/g.64714  ORF Transcript_33214/g.64714 Transcript_33214/m.64714 type:complete len:311 (+) Transcript_33214:118-1050(+)|eukprot:CAMPEP_0167787780 /NCGR_PEP_ID=MMETSP0111_2-20121227/9638_1 /TAXON_ID=91324 /ORGANISM="Lotharella globosa, Strain CCCM811" /LENGTH=310 /DNA_ID=CAMNT_0007679511 /DNA_START=54 /DNA_END=986 /DNA_ORIENTATION=+
MARVLRGDHKFNYKALLGRGTFGEVYRAVSEQTGQEVAIKKELGVPEPNRKLSTGRSLAREYRVLRFLDGGIGIPRPYYFVSGGDRDAMVYECLGQDLGELLKACGGRFGMKTVLMLADQMLSRLEFLHSNNIVHRDIKPQNFTMGLGKNAQIVYLIDYGLCIFVNPNLPPVPGIYGSVGVEMVGTARFASINAHAQIRSQTFSDDLESLAYVLIFLRNGKLPWQGTGDKKPFNLIRMSKERHSLSELCQGFPREFQEFIKDARADRLRPPYHAQRKMFRKALGVTGVLDWQYDWVVKSHESKQNKRSST